MIAAGTGMIKEPPASALSTENLRMKLRLHHGEIDVLTAILLRRTFEAFWRQEKSFDILIPLCKLSNGFFLLAPKHGTPWNPAVQTQAQ